MPGEAFDQLNLFHDLRPHQRALIRPLFTLREYPAGTTIFNQGEPTHSLYLVLEGEVVIQYKPEDGPVLIVTRVPPQGVVGWSAALGSPQYTSSAVCATDCRMFSVRSADLRRLCVEHPDTANVLLEHLAAGIAERLRNTHEQVIALLHQGLRLDHPATA